MKTRVTWNLYSAALLVNAYITIKRNSKKRNLVILKLSDFLRGQIDKKKEIAALAYGSTVDINQKLGKLEYLMTDGQRGIPGVVLPCMQQAVDLYKNDHELYLLYKKAAKKKVTLSQLKKQLAKKEEKKEKTFSESAVSAEAKTMNENPVEPEAVVSAESESVLEEKPKTDLAVEDTLDSLAAEEENAVEAVEEKLDFADFLPLDAPVQDLHLTTRLENILRRNGIFTIENMLDYPEDKWMNIHGMGAKTFTELCTVLKKCKVTKLSKGISPIMKKNEDTLHLHISYDMPIQKLDFGRKNNAALQKAGFNTLRDVLRYPTEKWYELPELRVSWIEELMNRMETYRQMARDTATKKRELESKGESPEKLAQEAKSIAAFADMIGVPYEYMMETLHEKKEESEPIAEKLWEEERVQTSIKSWVLQNLQASKYEGLAIYELTQKFPEEVYSETVFSGLLDELQESNQIRRVENMVFRVYPSFVDYLSNSNEKIRRLMTLRLEGKTLEAVAQEMKLTREGVRQIQKKIFQKVPLVEEGYWLSVQKKFNKLTAEDFSIVFQLPAETVTLLQLWGGDFANIRTADKESRIQGLRDVLNDAETDEETYKRAQERLDEISPYFMIDGRRIPQKRDALVRYAIKTYCQEQRSIKELKDYYDKLRKKLGGKASGQSFEIDWPYLEHYLNFMTVLAGGHKRLRYYDILANDYCELLDELDFASYSNVAVSALKFFRDYPEVMKKYDIQSEQELHNLLKKLWEHGHYNDYLDEAHKLTLGRMPILIFGKADRAKQIVQLLRENNPISYMDFVALIEKEYGISQQTALANWIDPVDKYLVNGTYVMSEVQLPASHLERLKELLTEDYYLTAEIRNAYVDEYPEVNPWDISKSVMDQMGFISYGKYAIRNTYKSTADFFEKLFEKDVVDVRDKQEFSLAQIYYSVRQRFQEEHRIVEVEPGVFYNICYLNELGINKDDILNFCKEVYRFVSDEKCFTIQSLKQKGFVLPWADGAWTDWFYGALLSSDKVYFNSQRLGTTKLLRRRKMERKLTLADLLEEITDEASYMLTPAEICQILRFKYGIESTPFRIKEIAQSDDMFEDRILY